MFKRATLIITNDIEKELADIQSHILANDLRIIKPNEKSEFLLEQSKLAIKEAYISSKNTKYICIYGESFRIEAQNSLLKTLEEPPKNIIFIIISTSKSAILPTIISRVNLLYKKKDSIKKEINLDLKNLSLKQMYNFLDENKNISKLELKEIIYALLYQISKQNIKLDKKLLDIFDKSIKLAELNSKPINILTNLLYSIYFMLQLPKNNH